MSHKTILGAIGLAAILAAGCRDVPPPPNVPVPAQGATIPIREHEPVKPLPPPSRTELDLTPRYDDQPLIHDPPAEQREFVQVYRQVGAPRITVFVNRTLQGDLVPSQGARPRDDRYLDAGQYDEADVRSIDYEAMETILTDWIASDGQVSVVSPIMVRQRLTDGQLRDLESGRPQVLPAVAQQLETHVLIQVQARPTRQASQGLGVRVIAEALNIQGGESIGRAVVDVDPPLTKQKLNGATRWVARTLMDDMTETWMNAPAPAPTTQTNE